MTFEPRCEGGDSVMIQVIPDAESGIARTAAMMPRPLGESGEEGTLPGCPRSVHGVDSASHLLIERSKRPLKCHSGISFNQKFIMEGAWAVTLPQLICSLSEDFLLEAPPPMSLKPPTPVHIG